MIGSTIHRLATCTSTNDVARELAQAGAEGGTVVIARAQTGGRGTKGRSWHSAPGKGLYLSVVHRPRRNDIALLPATVGLAVVEAIGQAVGLEARLKWPNDVVWGEKKIAGILCESSFLGDRPSYVIVGIGVNVNHARADFPAEIRAKATSLRLALGKPVAMSGLERALLESLERRLGQFERGQRQAIVRAFESRLVFPVGAAIRVTGEREPVEGLFRGIDTGARFIVECGGQRVRLSPAEILDIEYSL